MLQFIDISSKILYDMEKAHNRFLSLINACISHELRNPLNSIMAQNVEKKMLYERMTALVGPALAEHHDKALHQQFKALMTKLEKGIEVQDSSANLMAHLVQDFLDYA
jgi:signal transduction histidine kinase